MRARFKKRMRKSTKYTIVIISIVLLIISFNSLLNTFKGGNNTETREIYRYTDKFNYDYKINLIDNKYMKSDEVEDKSLAYVTDLIDNINLDLNYEYIANRQSNLKYSYSVEGKMQVVYSKDGE